VEPVRQRRPRTLITPGTGPYPAGQCPGQDSIPHRAPAGAGAAARLFIPG
jgi:hypothetical protein